MAGIGMFEERHFQQKIRNVDKKGCNNKIIGGDYGVVNTRIKKGSVKLSHPYFGQVWG
jgi:hypothetical protein